MWFSSGGNSQSRTFLRRMLGAYGWVTAANATGNRVSANGTWTLAWDLGATPVNQMMNFILKQFRYHFPRIPLDLIWCSTLDWVMSESAAGEANFYSNFEYKIRVLEFFFEDFENLQIFAPSANYFFEISKINLEKRSGPGTEPCLAEM